ncbi:DNA helicase RecQ [Dialister sp.]|uniref:DNA helicase RecQ n=1 Tax=Dialister sp. TaxID=1955814 RepID=UPI003F0286FE
MGPSDVLKRYFGYDAFRPRQREVIDAILHGEDVMAIMPTGAGKSICFQIPALLFPYGTVIISPLISLMKDQVESLTEQGIPASFVNSTIPYEESIERLRNLYRGRIKLLYMAPEKLEPSYFTRCLAQVPLSMIVIDEAHCVSQWGHDFRPSYRKISDFIRSLPHRPVVTAFTATATPVVEADMKRSLGLENARVFRTGLDRPNLSFRVIQGTVKEDFVLRYVKSHKKESGIIYCATRKAVDAVYDLLRRRGISVGRYHAGMDDEERRKAQEDFSFDNVVVMVATNAFGMGIDKSNVRYVIHYQMPKSLEAYYQEAGRAGRDGAKSECILLYSGQDARIQRYLIEQGNQDEDQRKMDYHRLNAMVDYCQTTSCLRNFILAYFGEKVKEPCGHCGNCESGKGKVDVTDTASLVFRTIQFLHERFGAAVIADVLHGSHSRVIMDRKLDQIPTYGKLSFEKAKHIKSALNNLIADGYLRREGEPYAVLKLTDRALQVLAGKAEVYGLAFGAEDVMADAAVERKMERNPVRQGGLFERLRKIRTVIAREEQVPPFVVFSDATLEDMAVLRPRSLEDMGKVHGVGAFKLEKYGSRFLEVLRDDGAGEEQEEETEEEGERESGLLDRLKELRQRLAREEHKAPKSIFSDEILSSMALQRPVTMEELKRIRGIGVKKASAYGLPFLKLLQESLPMPAAEDAGSITRSAYFLFLKKVRDRLAGKEGQDEEQFFPADSLHRLSSGDTEVLKSLPVREAEEFRKAIANYRKITGKEHI